jgi:hypothetical protein
MTTIYLDTCCLNRPHDDLNDSAVRLEAEAVINIVDNCERGVWELWGSGDYTKEREKLLEGVSIDDIVARIHERKAQEESCIPPEKN